MPHSMGLSDKVYLMSIPLFYPKSVQLIEYLHNNSNNYCYHIDDGIGFSYNTNKEIDGRNQNE